MIVLQKYNSKPLHIPCTGLKLNCFNLYTTGTNKSTDLKTFTTRLIQYDVFFMLYGWYWSKEARDLIYHTSEDSFNTSHKSFIEYIWSYNDVIRCRASSLGDHYCYCLYYIYPSWILKESITFCRDVKSWIWTSPENGAAEE